MKNFKNLAVTVLSAVMIASSMMIYPQASEKTAAEEKIVETAPSAAETAAPAKLDNVTNLGNVGNLSIPDLKLNVALNGTKVSSQLQAIVDAQNSALYHKFGKAWIIGDHAAQGFKVIKDAAGKYAYVTFKNGTQVRYLCTGVYQGHNNGDLILNNGVSVTDHPVGDLTMYTCMDSTGRNVYITAWKKA